MKTTPSLRFLTEAALIAAMYAALTLALPFMTFGPVQCRIAEALPVLPVLTPAAVPGLLVGCLISNSVGLAKGANVAGALDILLGTLATTVAALLTRLLRNKRLRGLPVLATLPPVLLNAGVVGGELTLVTVGWTPSLLAVNMLLVGAGQLVACTGGGLLLFKMADKVFAKRIS